MRDPSMRGETDESAALRGFGAEAYLDIEQILAIAAERACDAIHPGYGFLSENPHLASCCAESGIVFVGPRHTTLELFGDKVRARMLAGELGIPVVPGVSEPVSLERAREFFGQCPPGSAIMIKAVGGGGGRGIRIVASETDLEAGVRACAFRSASRLRSRGCIRRAAS